MTTDESRLRDINFQGFAARLTTEGVFDLSRLAVYRLCNFLEEDPDYCIHGFDKQKVLISMRVSFQQQYGFLSLPELFFLASAGSTELELIGMTSVVDNIGKEMTDFLSIVGNGGDRDWNKWR